MTEEEVTTVESFRDYIKEELSRRGKASGKLATVSINKNGGRFVADDDSKLTVQVQDVIYCLDAKFKDIAIAEIGEERLAHYLRG